MAGNFCYYRVPGERTAERVGYARAEDLPPLGPEERGKNVMYYYPDAQETYPVYLRECGEEHATAEKCVENRINPKVTYLHFLLRGRGTFNGRALTVGEGFAAHAGCVHSLCADPVDPMEFVYIGIGGYDHARWLASLGFSREEPFFSFSYENRLTAFLRNALYRTPAGVRAPAYLLGMLTLLLSYQYPLSPGGIGRSARKISCPRQADDGGQPLHDIRFRTGRGAGHLPPLFQCAVPRGHGPFGAGLSARAPHQSGQKLPGQRLFGGAHGGIARLRGLRRLL